MITNVVQGLGSLAFIAGLYLLAGLGWALLIVGALAVAIGVYYEWKEEPTNGVRETAESGE